MRSDLGTAYEHRVLRVQREASARGEFYTSPEVSAPRHEVPCRRLEPALFDQVESP